MPSMYNFQHCFLCFFDNTPKSTQHAGFIFSYVVNGQQKYSEYTADTQDISLIGRVVCKDKNMTFSVQLSFYRMYRMYGACKVRGNKGDRIQRHGSRDSCPDSILETACLKIFQQCSLIQSLGDPLQFVGWFLNCPNDILCQNRRDLRVFDRKPVIPLTDSPALPSSSLSFVLPFLCSLYTLKQNNTKTGTYKIFGFCLKKQKNKTKHL